MGGLGQPRKRPNVAAADRAGLGLHRESRSVHGREWRPWLWRWSKHSSVTSKVRVGGTCSISDVSRSVLGGACGIIDVSKTDVGWAFRNHPCFSIGGWRPLRGSSMVLETCCGTFRNHRRCPRWGQAPLRSHGSISGGAWSLRSRPSCWCRVALGATDNSCADPYSNNASIGADQPGRMAPASSR